MLLGQLLPGQILPEQMSLLQLSFIKGESGKLPLKFGKDWMSKSRDIADIELVVVVVRWWCQVICQTQLRSC